MENYKYYAVVATKHGYDLQRIEATDVGSLIMEVDRRGAYLFVYGTEYSELIYNLIREYKTRAKKLSGAETYGLIRQFNAISTAILCPGHYTEHDFLVQLLHDEFDRLFA